MCNDNPYLAVITPQSRMIQFPRMKTACLLLCAVAAHAQLLTLTKDQMVKLTAKNPFERFDRWAPEGTGSALRKDQGSFRRGCLEPCFRVKVSRTTLPASSTLTQPGTKLVGRVVTAQFMPVRGDLNEIITGEGKQKGYYGGQNQWIIDQLQPGDVLVVDLFGKDEYGTFVGDNLAYYIMKKTGTGLVVDGSVRDLDGIATVRHARVLQALASHADQRCDAYRIQRSDPYRRHHCDAWRRSAR